MRLAERVLTMNLQQYRQGRADRLARHKHVQDQAVFRHRLRTKLRLNIWGTNGSKGVRIALPAPWSYLCGIDGLAREVVA